MSIDAIGVPISTPSRKVQYQLLGLFLILAASIAALSYRSYLSQKIAIEHEVRNQLLAIADMKVKHIAQWRFERLAQGQSILHDQMDLAVLHRLCSGKSSASERESVLRWLDSWRRDFHYANAILTDQEGSALLVSGTQIGDRGHLRGLTREVIAGGSILLRDFQTEGGEAPAIHLGLNLPLRLDPDSPPFGALLLGLNPSDSLYPMLAGWPLPSASAETLLVRREGNEVVFLNQLRHRQDAALKFRLSLDQAEVAAVRGVHGERGAMEALDYRGVPVFAAVRPVPDTNWLLVTKMDAEEVHAPILRRSVIVGELAVTLILLAAAAVMLLWRREKLRFYSERFEAEAAHRALIGHYDYLTRFANDTILLTDEGGRIVEANDRAVTSYGYSREELQGMNLRDLRTPAELGSFRQQYREVAERGELLFETMHACRNGRVLPVEVSARLIEVEGKRFFQCIIRNIGERKAMTARLHGTLDTLTTLIAASPAAIISLDREARVTSWSRAAERMFGWTEEEVMGALPPSICDGQDNGLKLAMERILKGQPLGLTRRQGRRRDGTEIALAVSMAPLHYQDGAVTGGVVIIQDNSEQYRAEQALEEGALLFQATFEQAAVGMAHLSLDGRLLQVNQRFCDITGYPREELLRSTAADITHPDDLPASQVRLEQLLRGDLHTYSVDKRYLCKDGGIVWVQVTSSLLRDTAGRPVHFVGVVQDVSERIQAGIQLRQSEDRFRQVVENAPDAIAVVQEGQFRYLNPAALRVFGATRAGELLGQPALSRFPAEEIGPAQRRLADVESRRRVPTVEVHCMRLDGEIFPAEISAAPIEFDQAPAVLVFFNDITERRQAEEQKAQLEQQLRQAQKMESIGRLAGGVAHDFNNHLTVINGYCDMLLGDPASTELVRAELEEIRSAGGRAAALTQQLLAFSRKQMAERKPVMLNELIEESKKMLGRLIGEDIAIETNLDPGLGWVTADRGQLHQVLMNLSVNARDAMPEGGKIVIGTATVELPQASEVLPPECKPGRYALWSVTDTGIGMSADIMQKIFEPFFTTKPRGMGTGLGLATAYGIVQQSGGWIQVNSQEGHGTTFRIYLPLTETAGTPSVRETPVRWQPGTETVLIVEDQPEVRKLAHSILSRNGYKLLEAADGEAALRVCEAYPGDIHLLITDVVMPGMNGRELAGRLLAQRPSLHVLYISGYAEDVIGRQGVLDPGVAYLPKPFGPAELAAKVRAVLGLARTAQRILLIDDDEGVRSLLAQTLAEAGYRVRAATNGKDGLRCLREAAADLVLTDLVMPEQEGLETIKQIRQSFPGMRLIAMSGAFGGGFLKTAALMGAHATLLKPITPEWLLVVVRDVLARSGLQSSPVT